MSSEERIAKLAGAFSDSTRIRIINLLLERGSITTMDITTTLGVPQPRVSSHLAVLLKCNLVSVVGRGRQRIYSVEPRAVELFRDFEKFSSNSSLNDKGEEKRGISFISREARREVERDTALRQGRTCYDHLAGVAGIDLLKEMIRLGWLSKRSQEDKDVRPAYLLTRRGSLLLREKNVDLDAALSSKRTFAYGCLDWTERQPHLGGSLGRAILDSILRQGIASKKPRTRALKLKKHISSWIES